MGMLGVGYGSEWHLWRYLGYHRGALNRAILREMPDVKNFEWFDFPFDPKGRYFDRELKGVEFLMEDEPARQKWLDFWPVAHDSGRGNPPNWDAVCLLTLETNDLCWLLVEAKAHLDELGSSCHAKPATVGGGRDQIQRALDSTRQAVQSTVPVEAWMSGYYQHAAHLAVLHHLESCGTLTRLLNIYFLGDKNPAAVCPQIWDEWGPSLEAMEQHLGLTHLSSLESRVHSLFLPVCGDNGVYGGA